VKIRYAGPQHDPANQTSIQTQNAMFAPQGENQTNYSPERIEQIQKQRANELKRLQQQHQQHQQYPQQFPGGGGHQGGGDGSHTHKGGGGRGPKQMPQNPYEQLPNTLENRGGGRPRTSGLPGMPKSRGRGKGNQMPTEIRNFTHNFSNPYK